MTKLLYGITFLSIILLGFLLSWKSIPNQEGYAENFWNLSHLNFQKFILYPNVTPLNFLSAMAIERLLHLSVSNTWKLLDLSFGAGTAVFILYVYSKQHQEKSISSLFKVALLIISSFGFVYSFTSMTGEGLPIFFAVIGVYLWQRKKTFASIICFMLSFLSKYTVYLIGPGIGLWTFFHWQNFSKNEKWKIIISGIAFATLFFAYHLLKQGADLAVQGKYAGGYDYYRLTHYLPAFLLALFLGAPLSSGYFFSKFTVKNIYALSAVSAFLLLLRHYFYWHYVVQIIPFLLLYALTAKDFFSNISWKKISFQLGVFISIALLLPIRMNDLVIFPKHLTTTELLRVDQKILTNYHQGSIGYYQNRRFDEVFPNYEISYFDKISTDQLQQTEYVVLPTDLFPQQLQGNKDCSFSYFDQTTHTMIYKVNCISNSL